MLNKAIFFFAAALLCSSCKQSDDVPTSEWETEAPKGTLHAEANEAFSGGTQTVFDQSVNAFGFQSPDLSNENGLLFFVGNSFFNQNWVTAPSSTTARDGLGPLFNARSCASCHFKDGRGRPNTEGEFGRGLLFRLSVAGTDAHGGPKADAVYGTQLQDQSILGVMTEGNVKTVYEEQAGQYPDGTSFSLRKPSYILTELMYGAMDPGIMISPRVAPQMAGMGLLEAVDESTVLSFADENDLDGDGISGKANYVWNESSGQSELGRFGWKANQPTVKQQVAGAFVGDMGITSSLFPKQNCQNCEDIPNGGDPEIEDEDLHKVVLYSATLAVPGRRDWEDEKVLRGKYFFDKMACTGCHVSEMKTGTQTEFKALANQSIRPYTDLLLHDMGEGLADKRPDYLANGNEWRTPPLWGIGLFETVNKHTYYLHDGRARNLEEAILWHGGEAENSKTKFMYLSKADREAVVQFLNSL
ncbi:c-type cytochrome [Marinilongibacter aquaticus]|uniref:di-heme oxidoreductase family protein n=1 Tax=Marinilongibacter aquaticus TaxID=2975157 RepID=UPI0021BDC0F8|nr:di-heme oxidoredictase family protein [Marinilongibacter aquaticus]UBM57944.1 c-type cytochrome [Marinilongibacter aquaticus]